MNAILSVIRNNKAIFVANDGRLLKKCLLGFLILSFAFQSNNLGDIVRNVLVEAYLQVSVFVGFTLFIFIGLDSLTKFNVENFLNKTKNISCSNCNNSWSATRLWRSYNCSNTIYSRKNQLWCTSSSINCNNG